jgi:hypothetical protein
MTSPRHQNNVVAILPLFRQGAKTAWILAISRLSVRAWLSLKQESPLMDKEDFKPRI